MDARKSENFALFAGLLQLLLLLHGFSGISGIQSKKYFTEHHTTSVQYTVLGVESWPVKCTAVTVGYSKISSNIPFLQIQAM